MEIGNEPYSEPVRVKLAATGGIRKPHRFRPGTVALREIRRYQKSTKLLINRHRFESTVRSALGLHANGFRIQPSAVKALQYACESYLTNLFETSHELALKSNRETILPQDLSQAEQVELDSRLERHNQYKQRRREITLEYRLSIPIAENEIEPWEWESDHEEDTCQEVDQFDPEENVESDDWHETHSDEPSESQ